MAAPGADSEKICEHIADVNVPQVVEQIIEVPKMAEQILDVLVPEMVEQLAKLSKTNPQDRIKQRTVEHVAADTSVPQDVEEPAEFLKAFSQDRVQLLQKLAIPLAEKIVELPRHSDGRKDATGYERVCSTRRQRSRSGEVQNHRGDSAENEAYHPGENQPGDQAD